MKVKRGLYLLVIIVSTINLTMSDMFNCRRKGQSCNKEPQCNSADGKCKCDGQTPSVSGFNCGITDSQKNATACSAPDLACENNAVCTYDGTAAKCNCLVDYYGKTCSQKRAQVKCAGDGMLININPVGNFEGTIFIQGKRVAACTLQKVPADKKAKETAKIPLEWESYYLDIKHVSTSCGDVKEETKGDGANKETLKIRNFILEYDKNIITNLDERLTATCRMTDSQVRNISGEFTRTQVTDNLYQPATVNNTYEPVVFTVEDKDGKAPDSKGLMLGDDVILKFNVPETSGYATLKVESVTANNTLKGADDKKTLVIIDKSCKTSVAKMIMPTDPVLASDNRTVTIQMKAFKFVNSEFVGFTCQVRICKTGETDCASVICTGSTTPNGVGRKKRDAQNENERTYEKILKVSDPAAVLRDLQKVKPEECLQKTVIVATIATLIGAIVLLLILCIVVTCRLLRSRQKVTGVQPIGERPMMTIPRPNVDHVQF